MNPKSLQNGAVAGVLGGIVFGIMMGMMEMFPSIGLMVGMPNAVAGFVVHLVISALIGASFSAFFQRRASSRGLGLVYGVGYGAFWWVLGPLTLMPLFLGMRLGVYWDGAMALEMLPSLAGHVIYGGILGFLYVVLGSRGGAAANA